jgi:4-hydroxy-tetrahydrodipicolinate synthase
LTLLEKLAARFENLIGYVYGGANQAHLAEVIQTLGHRLEVHCAGPSNAMTTLHLGGAGFIGHEGNLSPVLVANVLTAFERGDSHGLRESFRKLMVIHTMHRAHGGGRAMKPLLNSLGLPGGTLRPPRIPIAGSALEAVIQATLELKLPGLPAADALA